jgi:hypothetical protein
MRRIKDYNVYQIWKHRVHPDRYYLDIFVTLPEYLAYPLSSRSDVEAWAEMMAEEGYFANGLSVPDEFYLRGGYDKWGKTRPKEPQDSV